MAAAALDAAYGRAIDGARAHLAAGAFEEAFALLERAHVLGQQHFGRHLQVHLWMLRVGWAARDGREVLGQLLRLALLPLGHLSGRLPLGNSGRVRVSAFAAMPVADDLARLTRENDAAADTARADTRRAAFRQASEEDELDAPSPDTRNSAAEA